MLGRKELAALDRRKQALLLESGLNRVAFQAEIHSLRSAAAWAGKAASAVRQLAPLLVVLAPLGGFLFARQSRRGSSWFNRLATLGQWLGRVYRLWRIFAASRTEPGAETHTG